MKMIKKIGIFVTALSMAIALVGCASTSKVDNEEDANIAGGIAAWNKGRPAKAEAWFSAITDAKKKTKWMGYLTTYNEGVEALDNTEATTSESKLLSYSKTAISKFSSLDDRLKLPGNIVEKGATVTAPRIENLLNNGDVAGANKLYKSAVKVYGNHSALDTVSKKISLVSSIYAKRDELKTAVNEANEIEDVDAKIEAYNKLIPKYDNLAKDVNAAIAKTDFGADTCVKNAKKSFTKMGDDVKIGREGAIREKAYEYKEEIGFIFASPMPETGSGKGGALTSNDILAHYNTVNQDMQVAYDKLLEFQKKYPKEIDAAVIADINNQKKTLETKIVEVKQQIAREEEIASRGKFLGMIGLFNASANDAKKSKPAVLKGTSDKKSDYLWGYVDIDKGKMNDLVITMKDNRTVHVYNKNTRSGKNMNGVTDLISTANKVGNSWPVMNASKALGGNTYYVEVEPGKTPAYNGEAVIYASFITRSR